MQVELARPALLGGEHGYEAVEHNRQPVPEIRGGVIAGDQSGIPQDRLANVVDAPQGGPEFLKNGGPSGT